MRAVQIGRERIGAVRRTRDQDGRVARPFGDKNYGVQPHAVAHGNHDFAPRVIKAVL